MTTLRSRVLLLALVPVLMVGAGVDSAAGGAPNYECRAGAHQIGIDQHRRAGLSRRDGASVEPMPFADGDQSGSSLKLVATIAGKESPIEVRGYGTWMSLATGGVQHVGSCAFVPGNFVLGQVSTSKVVIRTQPSDVAEVVTIIKKGSLVWTTPGRVNDATGLSEGDAGWTRLRVVLNVSGGAANGGQQMLGMGDAAGLDGRSQLVQGWARVDGLTMLGPPGP